MRLIRFRLHASRLFFAFKNTPHHHHHHHHRVFTPTPTQSRAMVASTKTTLPRRRRRQPPRRAALTSSSGERRPKRKRVTTFKSSSSAADFIDGELPDETRKKRRGPRKVLREDQNDEEKVRRVLSPKPRTRLRKKKDGNLLSRGLILMMILMEDTTVQPNDVLRRTRARELPS